MYFVYSFLLSVAFIALVPLFLLRREKYASGFKQRLGNYPKFKQDGRRVIWLHCVSVGETNAARPLAEALRRELPEHRLVISTTTKTGQELAHKIFASVADTIVYFPFDWKFSVKRALENYKPSLVLLMETEIWPRFIHEAKLTGAKVAIVNGRLSAKSHARYSRFRALMRSVLGDIDLALMQDESDAKRIIDLGIDAGRVSVTGNLKFEQTEPDGSLTESFRARFGISSDKPLVVAASTHEPEEIYVIDALQGELGRSCRLMIVPRHPERFGAVARLLNESDYSFVRRSNDPSPSDKDADILLLDSIGELRSIFALAEIVFVGGSLIPHGGQNILEPAAEGKAIITGPHTENFDAIVKEFLANDAVCQVSNDALREEILTLLRDERSRHELGANALRVMTKGRDATTRTVEAIATLAAALPL
jgi:3-deoxy-D-manno-octulosonic-acid transferase